MFKIVKKKMGLYKMIDKYLKLILFETIITFFN